MTNIPQETTPTNPSAEHQPGSDQGWMGMTLSITMILGILLLAILTVNSFQGAPDTPLEQAGRASPTNPSVQRQNED